MGWEYGADGQLTWVQGPATDEQGNPLRYAQGGPVPGMSSGAMIPPQQNGAMDPYDARILQALKTGYPGRDQSFYDEQLNYYRGKRGSGETSAWATGQPGRTMDDYWVSRAGGMGAGGADAATAGQWAGGDAPPPGGMTLGQMSQSGYSNQPVNGVASFNAPGLAAPYTKEFQPTDINTILNAPAYKAAQANGVDQIQRSAAARGTLLTGGTLKDLAGYTQGLALGELNNQFNRDATTYGTNRDTFYNNQNNAYNKLSGFANTGLQGAQTVGGFGTTYARNATDLATGQGDASASATLAGAQNQNQTLGNLATNLSGMDWSKLFKNKQQKTGTNIGTNMPTGPAMNYSGAALPGTY